MRTKLLQVVQDQSGMETVEWCVLAAIIVAGLVAMITSLGNNVMTRLVALRDATD